MDVHPAAGHRKKKMRVTPFCAGLRNTKSSRILKTQFLAISVTHSNTVLNGATYGATQAILFLSVQKLPICEVRNICLRKNANAVDVFLRRISEHEAPPAP
jgi:limonene-1,2-epoxide hydrolase